MQDQKQKMEKICNEKTKPDDTDGHFRSILPCEFYSKKLLH